MLPDHPSLADRIQKSYSISESDLKKINLQFILHLSKTPELPKEAFAGYSYMVKQVFGEADISEAEWSAENVAGIQDAAIDLWIRQEWKNFLEQVNVPDTAPKSALTQHLSLVDECMRELTNEPDVEAIEAKFRDKFISSNARRPPADKLKAALATDPVHPKRNQELTLTALQPYLKQKAQAIKKNIAQATSENLNAIIASANSKQLSLALADYPPPHGYSPKLKSLFTSLDNDTVNFLNGDREELQKLAQAELGRRVEKALIEADISKLPRKNAERMCLDNLCKVDMLPNLEELSTENVKKRFRTSYIKVHLKNFFEVIKSPESVMIDNLSTVQCDHLYKLALQKNLEQRYRERIKKDATGAWSYPNKSLYDENDELLSDIPKAQLEQTKKAYFDLLPATSIGQALRKKLEVAQQETESITESIKVYKETLDNFDTSGIDNILKSLYRSKDIVSLQNIMNSDPPEVMSALYNRASSLWASKEESTLKPLLAYFQANPQDITPDQVQSIKLAAKEHYDFLVVEQALQNAKISEDKPQNKRGTPSRTALDALCRLDIDTPNIDIEIKKELLNFLAIASGYTISTDLTNSINALNPEQCQAMYQLALEKNLTQRYKERKQYRNYDVYIDAINVNTDGGLMMGLEKESDQEEKKRYYINRLPADSSLSVNLAAAEKETQIIKHYRVQLDNPGLFNSIIDTLPLKKLYELQALSNSTDSKKNQKILQILLQQAKRSTASTEEKTIIPVLEYVLTNTGISTEGNPNTMDYDVTGARDGINSRAKQISEALTDALEMIPTSFGDNPWITMIQPRILPDGKLPDWRRELREIYNATGPEAVKNALRDMAINEYTDFTTLPRGALGSNGWQYKPNNFDNFAQWIYDEKMELQRYDRIKNAGLALALKQLRPTLILSEKDIDKINDYLMKQYTQERITGWDKSAFQQFLLSEIVPVSSRMVTSLSTDLDIALNLNKAMIEKCHHNGKVLAKMLSQPFERDKKEAIPFLMTRPLEENLSKNKQPALDYINNNVFPAVTGIKPFMTEDEVFLRYSKHHDLKRACERGRGVFDWKFSGMEKEKAETREESKAALMQPLIGKVQQLSPIKNITFISLNQINDDATQAAANELLVAYDPDDDTYFCKIETSSVPLVFTKHDLQSAGISAESMRILSAILKSKEDPKLLTSKQLSDLKKEMQSVLSVKKLEIMLEALDTALSKSSPESPISRRIALNYRKHFHELSAYVNAERTHLNHLTERKKTLEHLLQNAPSENELARQNYSDLTTEQKKKLLTFIEATKKELEGINYRLNLFNLLDSKVGQIYPKMEQVLSENLSLVPAGKYTLTKEEFYRVKHLSEIEELTEQRRVTLVTGQLSTNSSEMPLARRNDDVIVTLVKVNDTENAGVAYFQEYDYSNRCERVSSQWMGDPDNEDNQAFDPNNPAHLETQAKAVVSMIKEMILNDLYRHNKPGRLVFHAVDKATLEYLSGVCQYFKENHFPKLEFIVIPHDPTVSYEQDPKINKNTFESVHPDLLQKASQEMTSACRKIKKVQQMVDKNKPTFDALCTTARNANRLKVFKEETLGSRTCSSFGKTISTNQGLANQGMSKPPSAPPKMGVDPDGSEKDDETETDNETESVSSKNSKFSHF